MKNSIKVGIGVALVVAVLAAVFPALKGPYNRVRNTVNEELDAEFIVDNYKAKYIELYGKRAKVVEKIQDFNVKHKVALKKLALADERVLKAKEQLLAIGTNDIQKFNLAKDVYESAKVEVTNLATMVNVYSNTIVKLESTRDMIDVNMSKAKSHVSQLESKKTLVDSIASVNDTVKGLKGVDNDPSLGVASEKLDDKLMNAEITFESMNDAAKPTCNDRAAAEAYLNSIK